MRKVLIVTDDYKEQTLLETFLRKFGFDTKAIRRDILLNDELLVFSPEIIIATLSGRSVDGKKIGQKLLHQPNKPQLILLHHSGEDCDGARAEALLERPLKPEEILAAFSQVAGLDWNKLMEKYQQMFTEEELAQIFHVTGAAPIEKATLLKDPERAEYFNQLTDWLSEDELNEWDGDRVKKEIESLRQSRGPEADDLDNLKKKFVRSLFKKS